MPGVKCRFHMGKGSAIHNGRNFDLKKADHIDQDLLKNNQKFYGPIFKKLNINRTQNIRQNELALYQKIFTKTIQNQNDRNVAARHPERNKTIDDYYSDKKTSPVETILSVGNMEDGYIPGYELVEIYRDYYNKFNSQFGKNIFMLDATLHCDEPGADHIHERSIFVGHNSHNELVVSKSLCFKELGIERPDLTKPEGRNNCPLQTFTKICRDMFIETCIEHGYDIDQEVQEYSSKSGLSTLEYKIQQKQQKHKDLQNQNDALENNIQGLQDTHDRMIDYLTQMANSHNVAHRALEMAILNGNSTNEQIELLQQDIQDSKEAQQFLDEWDIEL